MVFALIASGLWIVNSLYSIGYMRGNQEPRQTSFYVCFALALAATLGIAFAGNLFTLFLLYELLTLVTYPLVTHKRDEAAIAAGRVYLMILVGGSLVLFLSAIAWVFMVTGRLDFVPGGTLTGLMSPLQTGLLLALFVFGIGKAAVMPMHRWLPAAMVAPTPVSALLHAVAVVKAGVFSIVKIVVYVLGVENLAQLAAADWLTYVAGGTVILASIIALRQDDLKRRLAYSTISQLSYVVLAVSVLTPLSVVGATLHIAAHAFGKITLFFAAGAIYTAAHKTRISQLDGIGRRMPWTMTAFAIGALSMIGVPPTAGFISKWFIVSSAFAAEDLFVLAIVILSTLLNAAYFMPIVHAAFLKPAPPDPHPHGEAPWPMVVALTVTASATILLFLMPALPLALARQLAGVS
jgi:multicomponent Na+:H+ antiporter subunit D